MTDKQLSADLMAEMAGKSYMVARGETGLVAVGRIYRVKWICIRHAV
jgi:hypothetical protein